MPLPFSLPHLGLGCAPLGSMEHVFGYGVSEADAIATIHHALALGVTLLDTAPFYANGLSEQRVGLALRGAPRDQFILSTKVGWLPNPDEIGKQGAGRRSYSRDAVLRSVEGSLKRLGTNHLDIAHVHDPENGDYRAQILDEAYPTLLELKAQGVIRAIGAGLNQTDFLTNYAQHMPLDCAILAGRYTLLEQAPLREAFPAALAKGVAIFAAGVFNGGILATGAQPGARYQYAPAPEPILRLTRMIERVCAKHDVSLRAAAMQFAAAHPAVRTLIVGMAKPSEVDENLANLRAPLPPAFWAELKARELIDADAPAPRPYNMPIMIQARNVLGTNLKTCSTDPMTGWYRDGCCNTGPGDTGLHTVCARMTQTFLEFSRVAGNDLITPHPEFDFPGLQPGDQWCLCVTRWVEAYEAGCAPLVDLEATHISALEFVDLAVLKQYALSAA